ncbi:MlaD family protein [Amycolatopsis methanolica]|uniref:Mammalian cell entry related domain protein n=1 Tax=Amycolatopsis methanolica 239 TaxID=1068978 RepID=A0A076MX42_AMYME|nr:MlaD family protein [Amycolatopsis methanolica]AIJ23305.1 Mammalian cell entry related domain protein [Amycolatopsis methanolica 239]
MIRRLRTISPVWQGLAFILLLAVGTAVLFEKQAIVTALRPGDEIEISFARDYKLAADDSEVKVAGVPVGIVSGIEPREGGAVVVTVKIDSEIRERLGPEPTAAIRPTTILGGRYFVELAPGGGNGRFDGEAIPVERTSTPVELDEVLAAIPPRAQQGLQGATRQLDGTLAAGGSAAIRDVVRDAPGTLVPSHDVLDAMLGNRPETDLSALVRDVDTLAATLNRHDGQLESIVDNADTTSAVLARQSDPLARTIRDLPSTLTSVRTGLTSMGGILDRLTATAPGLRPAVQQAAPLLERLDPVLAQARPLVADLRPLLHDARPLVDQLVPMSRQTTAVLDDVNGAPLDRIKGPVVDALNEKWIGTGTYKGGGNTGYTLGQEIAHMIVNLDMDGMRTTANGATLGIQAGFGPGSVWGLPGGLDDLMASLGTVGGAPK